MKHFFIIANMASVLCCAAENTGTIEQLQPIMVAADKPFPDFVSAATATEIPPLPLPKNGDAVLPIDAVSSLVWKRLSTVDVVVSPTNKTEKLKELEAMGKIRGWLLKHEAYANLSFVAYIDETVTMSALSALEQGTITPDEARNLLAVLAPDITVKSILAVVQQNAPGSKALEKIRNIENAQLTLLTVSDMLDEDLHEQGVRTIANLVEQERPASLAFFIALSTSSKRMAALLIDLAGKGGDLNLVDGKVADEVERLMPEIVGNVDPASGLKIEAEWFSGLMKNVRKWKSRH